MRGGATCSTRGWSAAGAGPGGGHQCLRSALRQSSATAAISASPSVGDGLMMAVSNAAGRLMARQTFGAPAGFLVGSGEGVGVLLGGQPHQPGSQHRTEPRTRNGQARQKARPKVKISASQM